MSAPSKTLAVFGGAFNPPHIGHQMVVLYVLDSQDVDELLVVPCFRHAFAKDLAPFEHRLAMCKRAMRSFGGRVLVSDIEREIDDKKGRTLVMLQALKARRPETSLRLVIGADILKESSEWWRWDEIEKLAPPIMVARQGHGGDGVVMPDVSSTEIRRRLLAGESVAGLLARSVIDYVDASGLYRLGGDVPVPPYSAEPSEPLPSVFVVGAGPVGTALCIALKNAQVEVLGMWARRQEMSRQAGAMANVSAFSGSFPKEIGQAQVVVVAVRDDAIAEVAGALCDQGALAKDAVLLQCAGSVASEDSFAGVADGLGGRGTMHPLCAVPDAKSGAQRFPHSYFGIEGDDGGQDAALALVSALGGTPLVLTTDKMAAYHAAAVLASNHVVALLSAAGDLFAEAGVAKEHRLPALIVLARTALDGAQSVGSLSEALTGPVARGDAMTVARHHAALAGHPEVLELYRGLSVRALEIARQKASMDSHKLDQIEQILAPKRR